MTITLPDQYPLLPSSGRNLVAVGNRIGPLSEYAEIVDRDTWLESKLSRRLITSVRATLLDYEPGAEIVRAFARLSQPTRGIEIVCWHLEHAFSGTSSVTIDYDVIDDDTSLSVGSGTFANSAVSVKDTATVAFTGSSNIRIEIDAGGGGTGSPDRTYISGIQIYELNLTLTELP